MPKFRKKPVEIEAVQWTEPGGAFALIDWSDEALRYDHLTSGPSSATGEDWGRLSVETLEGEMLVSPGDWIIRGVAGEFYPCKPDIFEATYEPA